MGVSARQEFVTTDDRDYYFWHTTEGEAIRWGVFGGIFLILFLWMIVGYWHAKRRLSKGLPPLAYHRWLLSRSQRAIHDPAYRDPLPYYQTYRPADAYGMNVYPPPVYDPNSVPPPTYQPPPGATKVDPSQWRAEPTRRPHDGSEGERAPQYESPSGPPPARLRDERSGESANPFRG